MVKTEADVKKAINQYIANLEKESKVQRAFLYGSYARGNPREHSDIDVAIISDDLADLAFPQRQSFLGRRLIGCDTRIEPVGYSLDEYLHHERHPFLGEIIRTGRVVWPGE